MPTATQEPPKKSCIPPLREVITKGTERTIIWNAHEGQYRALQSQKRIVAVLCGSQWGKTEIAPFWLRREMERCGPGDYLLGTSTFKLLQNKLLPTFLNVFCDLYQLGTFSTATMVFTISKEGETALWGKPQDTKSRIIVFSGQSPEGAEAATAKAAVLDEAGQDDFKEETYEAILRRLHIHLGRILITTTLYNFGWLKRRIYDPWLKGDKDIDVIQADSIVNPAFPKEEWLKAKESMPEWKFDLFYRGRYSRPAGAVYDCFDTSAHVIKRFQIPDNWPRYVGHDFGPANMAAIWLAQNTETGDFIVYRAYHASSPDVEGHIKAWREAMPQQEAWAIIKRVGGVPKIEDGWRSAFSQAGWPILPPKIGKPEQQIARTYELIKRNKFFVFDDLTAYIDEMLGLSYKLDEQRQPTDKIGNDTTSHFMACTRYICSEFTPESVSGRVGPGADTRRFHWSGTRESGQARRFHWTEVN